MRRLFLLVLLGSCATPYAHTAECRIAGVEDAPGDYAQPRNDIEGLPNFAQLGPGLYRSAQPDAKGFEAARKMGVRTVVNLRGSHSDRDLLRGTGLRFVEIPFNPFVVEEAQVVAFLQVVSDPANRPVLVHCQLGADRTGMMAAIYRHMVQGWPMERAIREMPLFGFHSSWENMVDYLECMDCSRIRALMSERPRPPISQSP